MRTTFRLSDGKAEQVLHAQLPVRALALQDDGSLKRYRFSTPISDYQDFGGMRFGRKGDAVWHYPEGDFAYGSFVLKKVDYNVR